MCAIAGILRFDSAPVDPDCIQRMIEIQQHRGPDAQGSYINETIGLGHRRLAIIDLSAAGDQPMCNEDGTLWLTYNGEVYNYVELAEELKERGHVFRSNSDSEVIVHAFEEYGASCLQKFNGMFAFAIWDEKRERLFCARDRFGVKPFHYYCCDAFFAFASEIKGLLVCPNIPREPNQDTIDDYLRFGLADHKEDTFFSAIKRLKPGHYISIDRTHKEVRSYWALSKKKLKDPKTESDYVAEFQALFKDAVTLRLRSDAPVGTLLSGGLDSSSITCQVDEVLEDQGASKEQKTFSAVFADPKCDERQWIKCVTEATAAKNYRIQIEPEHIVNALKAVVWHQDEPFISSSIIAQWCIMQLAKEANVTVLLDGQGGDEALCGYIAFYFALLKDLAQNLRFFSFITELYYYFKMPYTSKRLAAYALAVNLLPSRLLETINKMQNQRTRWIRPLRASNPAPFNSMFKDHLTNEQWRQIVFDLPDLLRYEDRNSMAFSLETRFPFLDYRLVEFAFSLPSSQKIKRGYRKSILRRALGNLLPPQVAHRTDKIGFWTPQDMWMRSALADYIQGVFESSTFDNRPYFDAAEVRKMFEAYCDNRGNVGHIIWRCLNLEMWLRTFIDPPTFS
ncbi:MAG: asparagine synthase (glutamine-hydrolyzing) [Halobacteriota archaeon]